MSESFRATFPEGLLGYVTPDPASAPLLLNAATGEQTTGIGLPQLPISSSDSVMPLEADIGGELSASGTIDFTAAPHASVPGEIVDCTGMRLLAIEFYAPPTNAAAATIEKGAATPYLGLGATYFEALAPGMVSGKNCRKKSDGTEPAAPPADVGAGAKHLDVTLGAGDSLKWHALLGAS